MLTIITVFPVLSKDITFICLSICPIRSTDSKDLDFGFFQFQNPHVHNGVVNSYSAAVLKDYREGFLFI